MKKLLPIALTSSLVLPASVYAVGLSGIKVFTALNQPLRAEIRLSDLGRVQLSDVRVSLASPQQFERIGITRADGLSELQFAVTYNKKGIPVIRVTSKGLITDPSLQFAVSVQWPDGNFLRAYTLLLDPINYRLNVRPQAYQSKRRFNQTEPPHPRVSLLNKQTVYGPVQHNEDLWRIAKQFRHTATMSQAMVAIVRANPESFIRGNMNGLKAGRELAIPAVSEMKKIPHAKARRVIRAHRQAWANGDTIYYSKRKTSTQLAEQTQAKKVTHRTYTVNANDIPTADTPAPFMAPPTNQAEPNRPLQVDLAGSEKAEIDNKTLAAMGQRTQVTSPPIQVAAAETEKQVLKDEVEDLARENTKLKQSLKQREHDFQVLREEMMVFAQHIQQTIAHDGSAQAGSEKSTSAQAAPIGGDESRLAWQFILLLFLLAGGSIAYFRFTEQGRKVFAAGLPWDKLSAGENTPDLQSTFAKVKEKWSNVDLLAWLERLRPQAKAESCEQSKEAWTEEKHDDVQTQRVAPESPAASMAFVETPMPSDAAPSQAPKLTPEALDEIDKIIEPPKPKPASPSQPETTKVEVKPEPAVQPAPKTETEPDSAAQPTDSQDDATAAPKEDEKVDHVIEFEPGLADGLSVGRKGDRQEQADSDPAETDVVFNLADLGDDDPAGTKLELAQTYIDNKDIASAMLLLEEVKAQGNAEQIKEAEKLLQSLS